MQRILLFLFFIVFGIPVVAQTPRVYNAAEIWQQLRKLNLLGSVLYIAAHPDDENNSLLPYLSFEKLYRTAYLSLTRGDGGQNLIGDEQGVDLGLIRTQELIAARKIDGAEQYFSRAYEFGYSKSADETLQTWNKEKILYDVVWVIRHYQPDIIIKRFPKDSRAGHGHHAASAIIADEAFDAAADPSRFPDQLSESVRPWKARRILWNTYNFGSNNTTGNDQMKIDIGVFNPVFGKSYGEIGAEARAMHKSQGEGRPRRRGQIIEFFANTGGDAPAYSLMDGVDTSWSRISGGASISNVINGIINNYKPENPAASVPALGELYQQIKKLPESSWRNKKLEDVMLLIEACGGLFMEVTAQSQLNVIGDSAKFTVTFNNRTGVTLEDVTVNLFGNSYQPGNTGKNENKVIPVAIKIPGREPATQPYWLERGIQGGAYDIAAASNIGKAENEGYVAVFSLTIAGNRYEYRKPVLFKFTDPVKGELYQPIQMIYPVFINSSPSTIIFSNDVRKQQKAIRYTIQANSMIKDKVKFSTRYGNREQLVFDSTLEYRNGSKHTVSVMINGDSVLPNSTVLAGAELSAPSLYEHQFFSLRKISYDHIPDIFYNYYDQTKIIRMDLKTKGRLIGYIPGAGDKVPEALEAMGFEVRVLAENDITDSNLKQFDAIITGIRAYNLYEYLSEKNDVLNRYVKNGGNLVVQYMKSNLVGQKRWVAGPYPFSIEAGSRVSEEDSPVSFLLPDHPVLNYPNKITQKDFEGWVQERSTYQVVKPGEQFELPLGMQDKGASQSNGSLAIAKYGKGNFVYASLVFFRQLPAGVPGAFRLMANLIALPHNK